MNKKRVTMKTTGAITWAFVSVFLILVGAAVGLVLAGRDIESILYLYAGIVGIAGTTIPLLLQVAKLRTETSEQTEKLDQIHEQTNGVLDGKIDKVVRKILAEYFGELTK